MSAAERIAIPQFFMREAMPGDTWLMLPDVRQSDIDELAALGVTPEQCIRHGMQHCRAWTAFFNDSIGAIFGIIDYGDYSLPWAVFTNVIERYPITFLRESRHFVRSQKADLVNYVDARNIATVKWLQWLGFTIDESEPYGLKGELFHRFWLCAG